MRGESIGRRRFLAHTSIGAIGAAGLGLSAAVLRGAPGANDGITVGMIGCGDRASAHLRSLIKFKDKQNVRVTALCDVWQANLKKTAAIATEAFGEAPRTYTKFGELLDRKDIDAVAIVTPDFSHGPILAASLKAGKDVYVEKPMTIELSYANDALDLARKNDRVVQVGTQYRSQAMLLGVTKEIAAGAIGKISRVTSAACFNAPRWERGAEIDECKAADVDWDAYLLHLPKRPFDASLLREWQTHRETSNGMPGLWMVHYVDAMAMMMNAKYPATAVAHGGQYVWKDGRDHADTVSVLLEYPEGFLFDWAMSLGTNADIRFTILGADGTIEPQDLAWLSAKRWTVSSRGSAKQEKTPAVRIIAPIPGGDHMENFLECIRSRQRPRADIQFGHQHAVASIMAATALQTGRRQKYDADKRTIEPA